MYVDGDLGENISNMSQIRTMSALIAGVGAGVMGLTGITGAVFFFLCALLTSFVMLKVGCEGTPERYFPSGKKQFFSLGNLVTGAMTYILAWTVAYDTIYIF
ncbi:Rab5-interacting family protein [Trypanosoma conorhini]|uniref:ER membrane protein complex subunit 6 n=1 Tax=Trypanosoma conorhini TaxID=83891 RepID=A0A422NSL5_9TRYP|nr:Rab5-interacting family protein [Trypanosoma conorhini]RNF08470.1 Rab5-interacting family protein [Trypanosoma conorhini]